ncbi:hypothetical protein YC2023_019959 [Brassica napus]
MRNPQGHPEPDFEPPPTIPSSPRTSKKKVSSKLNRWSMGRALRSGAVKIDRQTYLSGLSGDAATAPAQVSVGMGLLTGSTVTYVLCH